MVGYDRGAERSRLFWSLLWCEGSKLKLNIPETTMLEKGALPKTQLRTECQRHARSARQWHVAA
eukprot:SAG11_NODE_266_length_11468_cov_11.519222_1_plen_64_part_00